MYDLWVFIATGPGDSFATKVALKSILGRIEDETVSITLSVQTKEDGQYLKTHFPDSDIFTPNFKDIRFLSRKKRYRSAVHSEILDQAWSRKKKAKYSLICDNDVVITGGSKFKEIIQKMERQKLVCIGTEYSRINFLAKLLGRRQVKPLGVPSCIFSVLDMKYYKELEELGSFSKLLMKYENPTFANTGFNSLDGKIIDTGFNLYLKPLEDFVRIEAIKCKNTFHGYPNVSLKNFLLGGDDSPEIYDFLERRSFRVNHFKKLSKLGPNRTREYRKWLSTVVSQ